MSNKYFNDCGRLQFWESLISAVLRSRPLRTQNCALLYSGKNENQLLPRIFSLAILWQGMQWGPACNALLFARLCGFPASCQPAAAVGSETVDKGQLAPSSQPRNGFMIICWVLLRRPPPRCAGKHVCLPAEQQQGVEWTRLRQAVASVWPSFPHTTVCF